MGSTAPNLVSIWIEVGHSLCHSRRSCRIFSFLLSLTFRAIDIKSTRSPFLFLAIDLPPPPLFQDTVEKNIIPQVPIAAVLAKYDGRTTQESAGVLRRFKITRLPPFLILHIKRFTKNNFVEEKNPTIVNFPLRGVDMSDCELRALAVI